MLQGPAQQKLRVNCGMLRQMLQAGRLRDSGVAYSTEMFYRDGLHSISRQLGWQLSFALKQLVEQHCMLAAHSAACSSIYLLQPAPPPRSLRCPVR